MTSPYLDRKPYTEKVRKLNDEFRRSFEGGRVHASAGVVALSDYFQAELMTLVRQFEEFNEASDPWSEHDFGSIIYRGERYFWKIDYFDLSLTSHSENPAEPSVTCRVLTVMRAEEY